MEDMFYGTYEDAAKAAEEMSEFLGQKIIPVEYPQGWLIETEGH
jgi:hypothetical protein